MPYVIKRYISKASRLALNLGGWLKRCQVVDPAGRSEHLSPILCRFFLELPLFPSRRLGEVKTHRVRLDAVAELVSMMETFQRPTSDARTSRGKSSIFAVAQQHYCGSGYGIADELESKRGPST